MASLSRNLDIMSQVRRITRQLEATADLCAEPIKNTLATQAALVAAEIRSVTPVSPDSPNPGALRESIRVEEGERTKGRAYVAKIKAGDKATDPNGYNYARAVEFGTQKMGAQPFFFPIWRARKKEVRAVIRKAVKLAVRQVFK